MDITAKLQTNKGSQFFKILFCAYTLMLFTVTLLPVGVIQSESNEWLMHFDFKNQDKVFHILLFFGFALLLRFFGLCPKEFSDYTAPNIDWNSN